MRYPILDALSGFALEVPPIWIMRQAGRYLPEYRQIRERVSFQAAVSDPEIAAEITLQPISRFGMDGAVIFADIMTPLEAMGVEMTFDPGPKLRPHTLDEVLSLTDLSEDRIWFVPETIRRVRAAVPTGVAVIGFAGAPYTLLAYLLEGGGSKDFDRMRATLRAEPEKSGEALALLARSMNAYLRLQVAAGAHVVQLFDSWAGLADLEQFAGLVVPTARAALSNLGCPTIYFAPGSAHTLAMQPSVASTAIGVDWRVRIDRVRAMIGGLPVQGNLDPAVLLTDEATIRGEARVVIEKGAISPGHVFNLGHGIRPETPPENVAVLIDEIRNGS